MDRRRSWKRSRNWRRRKRRRRSWKRRSRRKRSKNRSRSRRRQVLQQAASFRIPVLRKASGAEGLSLQVLFGSQDSFALDESWYFRS